MLRRGRQPRISLEMTDGDVVERLQRITGVGTTYERASRKEGWKPYYQWMVQRSADARWLMEQVLPLMGERRAAKIQEILAAHDLVLAA